VTRLPITKVQGTGNDFVIVDEATARALDYSALARRLCHRRFGVGADGLLVVAAGGDGFDASLRIFNADGSEAQSCGNGIRCVARYLALRRGNGLATLAVRTPAGIVRTESIEREGTPWIRAEMGTVVSIEQRGRRSPADLPSYTRVDVDLGNPHCVAFIDADPESVDLEAFAASAADRAVFPHGANVELARVGARGIDMRVRERGVGETWACGTGACAAAVAAIANGDLRSPVTVTMRGGELGVEWQGPGSKVYLSGGAEIVFATEIEASSAT
jgi:diaminopimelate epimerase